MKLLLVEVSRVENKILACRHMINLDGTSVIAILVCTINKGAFSYDLIGSIRTSVRRDLNGLSNNDLHFSVFIVIVTALVFFHESVVHLISTNEDVPFD